MGRVGSILLVSIEFQRRPTWWDLQSLGSVASTKEIKEMEDEPTEDWKTEVPRTWLI